MGLMRRILGVDQLENKTKVIESSSPEKLGRLRRVEDMLFDLQIRVKRLEEEKVETRYAHKELEKSITPTQHQIRATRNESVESKDIDMRRNLERLPRKLKPVVGILFDAKAHVSAKDVAQRLSVSHKTAQIYLSDLARELPLDVMHGDNRQKLYQLSPHFREKILFSTSRENH